MMQAGHEKRLAAKVMWYFPIIPHLKCLFAIAKTTKLMRWHAKDRVNDGKLRHPADGTQWRAKDEILWVKFKELFEFYIFSSGCPNLVLLDHVWSFYPMCVNLIIESLYLSNLTFFFCL
jgi:hypothetical protein